MNKAVGLYVDSWEKTGMLKDLVGHQKADQTILLENTRLLNEANDFPTHWNRMSLPIVARIYRGSLLNKIISVQPIKPDNGETKVPLIWNGKQAGSVKITEDELRCVWTPTYTTLTLDAEAEYVAGAIDIEITRSVIWDIKENVETTKWDFNSALGDTIKEKYESLYCKLVDVSSKLASGNGGNWIITSPEVASIFECATAGFYPAPSEYFTSALDVQYVGTINNKWKLFKDPLFPKDNILVGNRGENNWESGYIYCPQIYATVNGLAPRADSYPKGVFIGNVEDTTQDCYKLKTISAKKLIDPSYYHKLTIENFIF